MKRKTSVTPSRVWAFGCRAPITGEEHVRDQLRRAHEYYNVLIGIEQARRTQFRQARGAMVELAPLETRVAALQAEIETERTALRAKRGSARKRVEAPAEVARIRALVATLKPIRAELKAARAAAKSVFEPAEKERKRRVAEAAAKIGKTGPRAISRINPVVLGEMLAEPEWPAEWKAVASGSADTQAQVRAARAASGLSPGNYLLVERAIEAARRSSNDPEPKRGRGTTGRIGVQVHREPLSALMGGAGTMIQIDPLPSDQWDTLSKRRQARTRVRIRVGSEGQKPIWAEFPVLLHRKPPADAVVTWAWILVRREGLRTRYSLQLTLESQAFTTRATGSGVVAIDLGWRATGGRRTDRGIRVAYAVDDRGVRRELALAPSFRTHLDYASELRGIADKEFDAARATLGRFVEAWPDTARRVTVSVYRDGAPVTLSLLEAAEHQGQWRQHGRLARLGQALAASVLPPGTLFRLWSLWRPERIQHEPKLDLLAPPAEVYAWAKAHGVQTVEGQLAVFLDFWARKDRHLYQWETGQRGRLLRQRLDQYRCWAAELSRTYRTIVIEDFDLRVFARNAKAESDAAADRSHRIRTVAAPSEFRLALLSAVGPERVTKVSAVDTTRECHLCGHLNTEWTDRSVLVQECAGCNARWDQDENAARVLLKRWSAPTAGQSAAE